MTLMNDAVFRMSDFVGGGYSDFWKFKGRYRIVKGSRASKKSKTAALWYISNLSKARYKEANLLVIRKTFSRNQLIYERDKFVHAIRRFMEMKMLTKNLLTELIDRTEVHETEGVGKNRTQRVVIYYRFVGYLKIPEVATRFSEDTRQGVSVEYISCAPIKVHYGDDGEETEEGG